MDTASLFSVTSVLLLVAGVAIGMLAGHFTSPAIGEAKRLRSELDRVLLDQENYKASVNSHFRKTAELVGQMTKSYAAVYDHLAGGARTFCDDTGPEQKIPFGPLPAGLAAPDIETAAMDAPTMETAAQDAPPMETTEMDAPTMETAELDSDQDAPHAEMTTADDAALNDLGTGEGVADAGIEETDRLDSKSAGSPS
ncbi:MAG: YhcB family protein [Candidatus Binatia bacterium]